MTRPTAALALLLALAGAAAAELRIEGDPKVAANRMVRLKAAGDVEGAALVWDVDREDAADVEELGDRLLFAGPPGTYKVKLRAIRSKDGKTTVETARATVVVGGGGDPGPQPKEDPKDDPKPRPAPPGPKPAPPLVGKAWVVVIEETADLAADRGRLFASKDLADYVRAKGWRLRVADKDAADKDGKAPADLEPYIDRAAGKGCPQVYVVDEKGGVRHEGALPKEPADLLGLLKKIGGD